MFIVLLSTIQAALLSKRGAAMVEYALLAALIAIVVATAATTLGTNVSTKFVAAAAKV